MSDPDPRREFLRHTLATLAYRGGKAVRGAPASFAELKLGETTRTPIEVLAHIGDLLEWGLSISEGTQVWNESGPLAWDDEVDRFFAALERIDAYLASDDDLDESCEKLFQGPIADSLQHVGQLTITRRLGDAPIRGENYHRADVVAGRVGAEQTSPKREFD